MNSAEPEKIVDLVQAPLPFSTATLQQSCFSSSARVSCALRWFRPVLPISKPRAAAQEPGTLFLCVLRRVSLWPLPVVNSVGLRASRLNPIQIDTPPHLL